MRFIIKELDSVTSEQEITIGSSDIRTAAIRPHIYKHNSPAGSLKVEIRDDLKRLVATSETIAISLIDVDSGTTGLAFYHGYIRFNMDVSFQAARNYFIRLVGVGYTFSEAAYIGWVRDEPDFRKVTADFTPNAGAQSALDVEIWQRQRFSRGSS